MRRSIDHLYQEHARRLHWERHTPPDPQLEPDGLDDDERLDTDDRELDARREEGWR
jgi:hypothetical protein